MGERRGETADSQRDRVSQKDRGMGMGGHHLAETGYLWNPRTLEARVEALH